MMTLEEESYQIINILMKLQQYWLEMGCRLLLLKYYQEILIKLSPDSQIELINLFSNMVGHKGMVGGQAKDIRSNQSDSS